ncbi:MAG: hypothetical protein GY754_08855 [bacterium]|nr:hypothetical protein [bacterium]
MNISKCLLSFLISLVVFLFSCGPFSHEIKYEVIGENISADIYYTGDENEKQEYIENQTLTWEHEFTMGNKTSEAVDPELILCAEKLSGDDGSITLNIYVDSELESSSTVEGPYTSKCISTEIFLDGGYI